MGLFSVRGRLPQPARPASTVSKEGPPQLVGRLAGVPARLARAAGAITRKAGRGVATQLGKARVAAIAATNDARIVAVLLLLAAVALGLEMAASFHLI